MLGYVLIRAVNTEKEAGFGIPTKRVCEKSRVLAVIAIVAKRGELAASRAKFLK